MYFLLPWLPPRGKLSTDRLTDEGHSLFQLPPRGMYFLLPWLPPRGKLSTDRLTDEVFNLPPSRRSIPSFRRGAVPAPPFPPRGKQVGYVPLLASACSWNLTFYTCADNELCHMRLKNLKFKKPIRNCSNRRFLIAKFGRICYNVNCINIYKSERVLICRELY